MNRSRNLGNRPMRFLVVVASLFLVLMPSISMADDWDFSYGSPGPLDYSTYLEVLALPGGGALLIGAYSGEFESLSAGATYKPFAQFRAEDGSVLWTSPIDGSIVGCGGLPEVVAADVDPMGNAFVFLQLCDEDNLLASFDRDGPRSFLRTKADFAVPSISSGAQSPLFRANPDGGIKFLAHGSDLSDLSASGSPTTLFHLDADLGVVWATALPDSFALAGEGNLSLAVAADGTNWVVDVFKRPLPHLNDWFGMLKVSSDGSVGASVQHFGYGCLDGYPSMGALVLRATSASIWVSVCDYALPFGERGRVLAFDPSDGHLLGDVALPTVSEESRYIVDEDIHNGGFRFSASGDLAFYVCDCGPIGPRVWRIKGDVGDAVWHNVLELSPGDGATIEDVDAIGSDELIIVGSTTSDEPPLSVAGSNPGLTESRLIEAVTNPRAFVSRMAVPVPAIAPVVPARLLETRFGPNETTVDHLFEGIGRQGAGTTLELKVTGRGGVPADAAAVMLNVTAVFPDAPGFLTVYPCGFAKPKASNVNYGPGAVVPNAVLVKVGDGGKVCIYTKATTDIIADVNGYVPVGGSLGTVVPARLLETRSGPNETTVDHLFEGIGRQGAGTTLELKVTGRGGVPADAAAVMLNVTAVFPDAPGFLTVYPCGFAQPKASNVNYGPGAVVSNAVLVKVGDGGKVCIYTKATTDIIADVNGYVPVGGSLGTVVPARLLETRFGPNETTVDHLFEGIGRQGAGTTLELKVTGRGGVPADAAAVMLNVTAVIPDAPGFLTVYPCGFAKPKASNVNYGPGAVVPNAVLVKVGDGGKVCIYTKATTDIIADVNGHVP